MEKYIWLENVNCPADLKKLPEEALPALCSEIRQFLVQAVSKTGGHLASNLGVVEITVGIHRVFQAPQDDIIFDVGHQCYVHKMLTGRREQFDSLRQFGGISGFLRPSESKYDSAVSGHASSSVSVALGMARAKKLSGKDSATVCVIGDGALTGGMAYEAMNDAGQSGLPLIVVFNDNDMSISPNVGALAKRLSAIRIKPRYFHMKERTKAALSKVPGGNLLIQGISSCKKKLRSALLKETLFELMGFEYLGPADGNDTIAICDLLEQAKKLKKPVVVHLKTQKGRGYLPSQQAPADFHGVSSFDAVTGQPYSKSKTDFSAVFGQELCRLAAQNEKICAVTAAMAAGTGLNSFAETYPKRFFDVGIAEEHAVAMSAGLATRGMLPVCAIYSTFLQRAYDQILHDVAINGNHVVFAIDRAGLVGADGETHQGMFDVSFLRTVPGMKIFAPASFAELRTALERAILLEKGPVAVRYPRGGEGAFCEDTFDRTVVCLQEGTDVTICTYGVMLSVALEAKKLLQQQGFSAEILKYNELNIKTHDMLQQSVKKTGRLLVLEDCAAGGCLGEHLTAALQQKGISASVKLCNLGDRFIPQGTVQELYTDCKIDAQSVCDAAKELCHG